MLERPPGWLTNQRPLIEAMKNEGYQDVPEEGVCFGITQMWVQAYLLGPEEKEKFYNRLYYITTEDFKADKALFEKNNQIQKTQAGIRRILTEGEQRFIDVRAFFDGVQLYFEPKAFKDIFSGKQITQQNIYHVASLVASNALKEKGGLVILDTDPWIYQSDQELFSYLDCVRDVLIVIKAMGSRVVLSLGTPKHHIALSLTEKNNFEVSDPNDLPGMEVPMENIVAHLKQCLYIAPEQAQYLLALQSYVTGDCVDKTRFIAAFKKLKEREHAINEETTRRHSDGDYLIHWVARYGLDDRLKELIENGADVNSLDSDAISPLACAIVSCDLPSIALLIKHGAKLQLSECTNLELGVQLGLSEVVDWLLQDEETRTKTDFKALIQTALSNNDVNTLKILFSSQLNTAVASQNLGAIKTILNQADHYVDDIYSDFLETACQQAINENKEQSFTTLLDCSTSLINKDPEKKRDFNHVLINLLNEKKLNNSIRNKLFAMLEMFSVHSTLNPNATEFFPANDPRQAGSSYAAKNIRKKKP